MIIFFTGVFGVYFLLLIVLLVGWRKAFHEKSELIKDKKYISVIVAMRNEAENIDRLLFSVSNQSYAKEGFEVILIDDHSEDGSFEKAEQWENRFSNIQVIRLKDEFGKKAAITKGISIAKGEIIVTTDADCLLPEHWLERINGKFQNERTNLVVGLVVIDSDTTFFSKLQSLEFASVIGTGVATLGLGFPTMCNGANLSFRKNIFKKINGYSGNDHIASGDDEFLMRKINNEFPKSIDVLNFSDGIVTTQSQATVKDFVQQRLRWASKWKNNSSFFSRSLAVFIFFVQLFWLAAMFISITRPIFLTFLIIKLIFDFIFIFTISNFLNIKFRFAPLVVLQFVYPFYVLYIGLFSQFKSHQWKGIKF